jgi:hypothetical protein
MSTERPQDLVVLSDDHDIDEEAADDDVAEAAA